MPHNGQVYGNHTALFHPCAGNQKDQAHADDLLHNLRKCGYLCLLHSIIIAVDTGMEGGKWHGDSHQREKGGTLRLHQDIGSEKIRMAADQVGQHKGHNHGDSKTGTEYRPSFVHVGCDVLGERSLNRTGTQGKADAEYRVDHVVDTKPFRTNGAGQEDTVEEAKDAAGEAGAGQKERAGQKGAFFFGQMKLWVHVEGSGGGDIVIMYEAGGGFMTGMVWGNQHDRGRMELKAGENGMKFG